MSRKLQTSFDYAADPPRERVAFEYARVLEREHLVPLGGGGLRELANERQVPLLLGGRGFAEAIDLGRAREDDRVRHAPHLEETSVERRDVSHRVRDDDPVGRGFERGLDERERCLYLALGPLALRRVTNHGRARLVRGPRDDPRDGLVGAVLVAVLSLEADGGPPGAGRLELLRRHDRVVRVNAGEEVRPGEVLARVAEHRR